MWNNSGVIFSREDASLTLGDFSGVYMKHVIITIVLFFAWYIDHAVMVMVMASLKFLECS